MATSVKDYATQISDTMRRLSEDENPLADAVRELTSTGREMLTELEGTDLDSEAFNAGVLATLRAINGYWEPATRGGTRPLSAEDVGVLTFGMSVMANVAASTYLSFVPSGADA